VKDELAAKRGKPAIAITAGSRANLEARARLLDARFAGMTIAEYLAEQRRRRFRAVKP
jgi:hypothetical protein